MRNILIPMLLSSIASISCFANEVKGTTLSFQVKDDVTFEESKSSKIECYSFKWGQQPICLLMLHMNSITSKDMLRPMVGITEAGFKEAIKKNKEMEIESSSKRDISLGIFSGTELEFTIQTRGGVKTKQHIFLLWDGEKCWNGQLTGNAACDISRVYDIIKSAKKMPQAKKDSMAQQ